MAAAILHAHGLRTGLFTSPHLHSLSERIQLDTDPISDEELDRWLARALEGAERVAPGDFSAFGVLCAAAAGWFSDVGADVVVWEAGIGGRLDPTRLMAAPVTILTQVALEHTALLGDDLPTIAADKAQLRDPGTPLIVGPLPPEAMAALAPPLEVAPPVDTCLAGRHQRENAGCAWLACQRWLGSRFDADAAHEALQRVRWPGRFEEVTASVWVDVAHNPSALERVAETAREVFRDRPVVLVIGVSRDRPWRSMVPIVTPLARHIVCTAARHRGAPPAAIAAAVPMAEPLVAHTVHEAMILARELAAPIGAAILVTGGLFLAAEAIRVITGS